MIKKKRGRPKKSEVKKPNIIIPIEQELILFYPYKLCDFENNLEKPTTPINNYNDNDQKIYVDNFTKNIIKNNNQAINEISVNTNIINISSDKIIYPNDNLINCPFCCDNKEIIIPDKTNICCMYDSCKMKCKPVFLPDKYLNKTFYIIGWFCSINCALSYNLKLNDNKVNERINLLYYLYEIHNDKIIPAPDILLLKKYGGNLSIEEFRKLNKNDKKIKNNSKLIYDNIVIDNN